MIHEDSVFKVQKTIYIYIAFLLVVSFFFNTFFKAGCGGACLSGRWETKIRDS